MESPRHILLGSSSVMNRIVGEANEEMATVNGVPCKSLIDTGSQVTTISESFHKKHLSDVPIKPLSDFLTIEGAGGQDVPFLGYIALELTFPFEACGCEEACGVLTLVVPDNNYNSRVPLTVGTNVLFDCRQYCREKKGSKFMRHTVMSPTWKAAYQRLNARDRFCKKDGHIGTVKASTHQPIKILPGQSTIIYGATRAGPKGDEYVAVVEPVRETSLPGSLMISPAAVTVKCVGRKCHVPVHVSNISTKTITVRPGDVLGEVKAVTWAGEHASYEALCHRQSVHTTVNDTNVTNTCRANLKF